MAILGAHMSIAGGYYKAVEAARTAGCDCVQLFTKNNNQWRAKEITAGEAQQFQTSLRELQIGQPLSHSSYLLNLASADRELWQKSVDALVVEVERANQLGIPWVVLHPGSFVGSSEEEGIAAVIAGLQEALQRTAKCQSGVLLETTAGQGSSLGHRFEHLAAMFSGAGSPDRLACCLDTCHVFAAGYPLADRDDYLATFRSFDQLIGVDRIRAFHLNDSKKELGSRVDRHEHIGLGKMGIEPFRHLLLDRRFRDVPMYLETPKGNVEEGPDAGLDWDVVNLRTLRGLLGESDGTGKPRSRSRR